MADVIPAPSVAKGAESFEGRGLSQVEKQVQKRIAELEDRLLEIETMRSSGLQNVRLVLSEGDSKRTLVIPLDPPLLPTAATHATGQVLQKGEPLGTLARLWGRMTGNSGNSVDGSTGGGSGSEVEVRSQDSSHSSSR